MLGDSSVEAATTVEAPSSLAVGVLTSTTHWWGGGAGIAREVLEPQNRGAPRAAGQAEARRHHGRRER